MVGEGFRFSLRTRSFQWEVLRLERSSNSLLLLTLVCACNKCCVFQRFIGAWYYHNRIVHYQTFSSPPSRSMPTLLKTIRETGRCHPSTSLSNWPPFPPSSPPVSRRSASTHSTIRIKLNRTSLAAKCTVISLNKYTPLLIDEFLVISYA